MAAGQGNRALRGLLAEAETSNSALARAIVRSGAAEGYHLGTSAGSVRRMLDGAQPRSPVPRIVARVLSRKLGYRVSVADCGFVVSSEVVDTFDGFRTSPTLDGTIAIVTELSKRDLHRRNFMLGSVFAAAAFAGPAWFAITAAAPGDLARAGGARVGPADIEVLRDTVRHFEAMHRRHGGGLVRGQVVQFLHQQARIFGDASYTDAVGRQMAGVLAEMAFLAGLTTVDSGRAALGQRYYAQALGLAVRAGDRSFAANLLAEMGRETIDIGMNSGDIPGNGQHAVALARSALQVIGDRATPASTAYFHVIEARALGMLGDTRATVHALDQARRAFDQGPAEEPAWLGHYTEVDLASDVGQCLRDADRPRQGLALLERALATLPAGRVTSKAKTRIHIAAAHIELGDFDAADHATVIALDAVNALSSERAVERVRALQKRARKAGARQVDERISAFLAT
ncbi:hypothetical protein [Actinokineospora enzanensis]|uniref:hypothetical protein n=1 Tax=Actinokineospora enzanensis TaxID=155975 RepID=UPI00039C4A3C|nr:hypothetical protein [Actinokineospora enzanensis]